MRTDLHQKTRKEKTGRGKLKKVGLLLFVCFLCLSCLTFAASCPLPEGSDPVVVWVEAGSSTRDVAGLLADVGVVRSSLLFRVLARVFRADGRLQVGEYRFEPGIFAWDALRSLVQGRVVYYTLTVREGLSVEEIADLIEERGFGSRDRFLEESHNSSLLPEFVSQSDCSRTRYALEGYLFPDTYSITKGMSEKDLVVMMVSRFSLVFSRELQNKARAMNLTPHQVATLASIVEKEACTQEERPVIAAVYLNRLKIGMILQADPTVLYSLGKTHGNVLWKDLEVDSPYNTYKYADLPPGPISNFGKACLEAVLDPDDVDYLYFVSKNDGTGTHAFARTLAEHDRNRSTYQGD